jgi:hypothetical protein
MSKTFTGAPRVTTLTTTDILGSDVGGASSGITAGNLRKAMFGFAAADPLNCGPLTATGNSTITGTLGGISTLTCTTLVATNITANITGNATTATNVAGTGITGTTLASNVVTSSLTTIGTLVAGGVPASLVTAGTFGAGAFAFAGAVSGISTLAVTGLITAPAGIDVTGAGTGAITGLTKTTLGAPNTAFTLAATFGGAGCPVTVSAAQVAWVPLKLSDALVYYIPAWR